MHAFWPTAALGLVLQLPGEERQAWTLDPDGHLAPSAWARSPPIRQWLFVLTARQLPCSSRVQTRQPPAAPAVLSDHVPTGEVWLISTRADAVAQHVWSASRPRRRAGRPGLGTGPERTCSWLAGSLSPAARRAQRSTGSTSPAVLSRTWRSCRARLPPTPTPGAQTDRPSHSLSIPPAWPPCAPCRLTGEFRYLGDLNHDGLLGPPVAPVAWAPDGRVVYGALVGQTPASTSTSPFSQNPAGLFLADPADAPGRPFGTTPSIAPLWLADGRLLAVGLPGGQDTGLHLRELDAQGTAHDLASIDVPAPGPTRVWRALGSGPPASAGHHQPRLEWRACPRLLAGRLRLGDLVVRLAIVATVSVLAGMLSGTAAAQSATATFDAPATTAIDTAPDPGSAATPAPTSDPAAPASSSSHSVACGWSLVPDV